MSDEITFSRKSFLLLAGAVMVAPGCNNLEQGDGSLIAGTIQGVDTARDYPALIGLGRMYLTQEPQENDRNALVKSLGLEADAMLFPLTSARQKVLDRHLEDLKQDRIVFVDGWMLSRTECRLYALGSLTA
jgi:hypothetical protein